MPHTVTAKRPPTDDARVLELANKASSVPEARHTVADDLRDAGVPQGVVDNVLVVVTELVSNAVRHAKPLRFSDSRRGFRLRWIVVDQHVLVDVTDGGGTEQPQVQHPSTVDPEGRGLAIVDALARDWSVRSANGEVTVQAVVGPWERPRAPA
jgi:serine/threonine-protein kinase RsbW